MEIKDLRIADCKLIEILLRIWSNSNFQLLNSIIDTHQSLKAQIDRDLKPEENAEN